MFFELCSRVFLLATFGVAPWRAGDIIYWYYPELRSIDSLAIARDDGSFDVLLLGGSVLDKSWSDIDRLLGQRLSQAIRRPVRIHNLGRQAHTSRDSLHKYRHLKHVSFDLVVFYHAINDARANNCPPDVFRSDYSHYAWYSQVNTIAAHPEINLWATPYVLHRAGGALVDLIRRPARLPEGDPPPEWVDFGGEVKTAASFRHNLTEIVQRARNKRDRLALTTFASYVAPGYTEEKFKNRQLDYGRHRAPIRLWGSPANVVAAIDAHNAAAKELAAQSHDVLFVDQAAQIPGGQRYFDDVCHLSSEGSAKFVDNLLKVVLPALQRPGERGQ